MEDQKNIIKNKYSEIARSGSNCQSSCCGDSSISKNIGYSDEEIEKGGEADMGLGCGNPVALSEIKKGDKVLDLGCGAGFDCFLAAEKTGKEGKVIGVDMTEEMIEKAKENIKGWSVSNVEFILSEIEKLPLPDDSVDIVISNCVINLSPDKDKVFREAYRVLKSGGKMCVSDIVLLKELSEKERNDSDLLTGCVAGALLKEDYLKKLKTSGFAVSVLNENKEISKKQYNGIALESLTIEARK